LIWAPFQLQQEVEEVEEVEVVVVEAVVVPQPPRAASGAVLRRWREGEQRAGPRTTQTPTATRTRC
jgi:hypothetical protein